jgi:hypothetical protein
VRLLGGKVGPAPPRLEYVGLILLVSLLMVGMVAAMKASTGPARRGATGLRPRLGHPGREPLDGLAQAPEVRGAA